MATTARQYKKAKHQSFPQKPVVWMMAAFSVFTLFLIAITGTPGSLPDFEAKTLSGESVTLSDYHGQVVMLNFWATWCPPCKAEMPAIEEAYEKYHDQGFTVLAINNGEQPDQIRPFANALSLQFPLVLDTDMRLQQTFGITGYPTSLFISPKGEIYATHSGKITDDLLEHYITKGLAQIE